MIWRLLMPLLLACAPALLVSCAGGGGKAAYYLSPPPGTMPARPLRHYPVARQGNLTAWLTSDHVIPSSQWMYAPDSSGTKHPIVGLIRASQMPAGREHDGCFLLVEGYDGPLYELWQGQEADGWLHTGGPSGWIRARLVQEDAVNTWVVVSLPHRIGGWSGYPVVVGENPEVPVAVAGAMWYKSNTVSTAGGATSTRMLREQLARLRFRDFVKASPAAGAAAGGDALAGR